MNKTPSGDTKLKKIIADEGLSQSELKRRTGLALSSVNEIANGVLTNYSLKTLYKICKATGKTPNDVLDYEDEIK